jgi:hypothetical protein
MRKNKTKTTGVLPYIIDCMAMNMHENEALEYLDRKGFKISRAELYRLKQQVKDSTQQRLNLIASEEFLSQHLERIDTLRTILKEMWYNYHLEKNPFKRVQILERIEENQVYLSSYYDSTRYVMEQAVKHKEQDRKKKKKELNEYQ